MLCISSNDGIEVLVLMTAAIRVAVEMFSYSLNTMFLVVSVVLVVVLVVVTVVELVELCWCWL